MSSSEDIGYMKGQIESTEERIRELDNELKSLEERQDKIEEQLALYRHAFMFVRTALWIGVAIMTLKFGDIPDILRGKE